MGARWVLCGGLVDSAITSKVKFGQGQYRAGR